MSLTPGARVGPYEVLSAIGAGGMGEVYRARDIKLNRDVALKVLPIAFTQDRDRLARFQREAQVLAALNHPNIAAIYGSEDSADGAQALVLELVDGPTLADRVERGPISIDEALSIARQIADALEAAHEQGIVHRDLKPANIKVRNDGTVKVLDFGLAKLTDPTTGPSGAQVTQSPTITSPALMTGAGMILGTAAYMSPEQAKGRPADKRSDIWAFGCVLFEMLAGKRVFESDDVSETLACVITKDPPWASLPSDTAPALRRLLRRCLEKDRRKRLAEIADARLELDEAASATRESHEIQTPSVVAPKTGPYVWMVTSGAVLVALVALLVLWSPWKIVSPSPVEPVRLMAELGADVSLVNQGSAIVLSPDGSLLAFVAPGPSGGDAQLFVRRLTELRATALTGTTGASNPFFSPDGRWIGFFAGGKLKKIAVTGGAAVTLADTPNARGGAWAEDGSIFFAPIGQDAPLSRVSSAGGKAETATELSEGEITHRWPQVLPGSKAVLYTAHNAAGGFDDAEIVVQPLPSGERKVVQRQGYFGRYVPTGHLLYIHEGTLFAEPFDLERLEVSGEAVPIVEDVASGPSGVGANGAAQFAVSSTGTFVYMPGGSFARRPIYWLDRSGRESTLLKTETSWAWLSFSPDGGRLAVRIIDGLHSDVWVDDIARDNLARLTTDPGEAAPPVWTPDGRYIAYASRRGERLTANIYWRRADGASEEQRLTVSPNAQFAGSWHPSGKLLAFHEINPKTVSDLMLLPIEGDETSGWKPGTQRPWLATPASEGNPAFSPDGRWLAYTANDSGPSEIYVRPFPGPAGRVQVSTGGGSYPIWSRAKRELFYQGLDRRIMVVPYAIEGDSFVANKPRRWSEQQIFVRGSRGFDVHPDGERVAFAPAQDASAAKQDKVVFVFNFFDQLRALAPVRKR